MDNKKIPIVSAKYKVPSSRKIYIERKELEEKIEHLSDYKVTIVKAGAGSGKTTLLSRLIAGKKLPDYRWITMDEGMNQVLVFWSYVFRGLKEDVEEHQEELADCLEELIQKDMLEQMIPLLADGLSKERPYALILDDFQEIEDSFLLQTLDTFLQYVPAVFHLILLSRTMPGIQTGSLFVDGELLLIDEREMKFGEKESRDFLTKSMGLVDEESIQTIIKESNGWIAGAQLLAVAGGNRKFDSSQFSSANEQIVFDYIERNIFAELSEEEQLFMEKTSVLGYINEEICDSYLPEYHFQHMMEQIMKKNLFVIVLDQDENEYRYHSIMHQFLQNRLNRDPDRKEKLYHRAAEIMFKLKDYDESIRLLGEIKDYKMMMKVLLQMPQNSVTFSYMMQVPVKVITQNPNFAYQYFFCHYASMDLEKCQEIYAVIRTGLKDDKTFCGFIHSNLFFDINWEFKHIKVLTRQQIDDIPLTPVTRAYLLIKEAYFLFLEDQVQDAISYLDWAEDIYRESHNSYILFFVLAEKTQILEEYGSFQEALSLYERMKGLLGQIPMLQTSYYIGIAGLYIRQLRMYEAKKSLENAEAVLNKEIETINSAYQYTLAEWYYIDGQTEQTERIILALAKERMYNSIFFSARLLRYPVYRGKDQALADSFLRNYQKTDNLLKNMDTQILYIGILFERGDKKEAEKQLDAILAISRKIRNRLKIVESTLMKARFLYLEGGEKKRILNLLKEALSYAMPEGIREPFWFEKEFLQQVFEQYDLKVCSDFPEGMKNYLLRILQECYLKDAEQEVNPDELTPRETEVLEEIAKGKTNREIAEKLYISVATVKTHLINIYSKLGVRNRMAAVNRYQEERSTCIRRG